MRRALPQLKGVQSRYRWPSAWWLASLLGLFGPGAPPAWAAGPEVLAVSASSADGMLMDAVDGDPSTGWQNKREGEREAWLAVRFTSLARVRGVRLTADDPGPRTSVWIETSRDGEHYLLAAGPVKAWRKGPNELTFSRPTEALYLRVRFQAGGEGAPPRFRIQELEPLGP
ncbi:MAG: discoidin domain-containing protein [Candidatus Sericytochromatia bacterium]|nr:discoidin domain-containing protein [Candidatus Sericytochromatia bacterium]